MTDKTKPKQEVLFKYQKTHSYRVFHVDGIYGGLTGKGQLYMDFFVEKNPVPNEELYALQQNELKLFKRDVSEAIVREIEGGLVMDYNMMRSMRDWLDDKIQKFEKNFVAPKDPTHKH